jgi:hypothetical protein
MIHKLFLFLATAVAVFLTYVGIYTNDWFLLWVSGASLAFGCILGSVVDSNPK